MVDSGVRGQCGEPRWGRWRPRIAGRQSAISARHVRDLLRLQKPARFRNIDLRQVASALREAGTTDFMGLSFHPNPHESAAISADWGKMATADGRDHQRRRIQFFDRPGLGISLNEDWVRQRLDPGEQWWG